MTRSLPPIAVVLGIAGLLPFVLCSLGALSLTGDGADHMLLGLAAYAAVILAFLGGVHWGFGLDAAGSPPVAVQRSRFVLGVLPSLIGWGGLLVTVIGWPKLGLMILAAGFVGMTVVEARATRGGWMPRSYMGLRWLLSVVVIVLLVSVVLVLALGGRVVL